MPSLIRQLSRVERIQQATRRVAITYWPYGEARRRSTLRRAAAVYVTGLPLAGCKGISGFSGIQQHASLAKSF